MSIILLLALLVGDQEPDFLSGAPIIIAMIVMIVGYLTTLES